jgi:hypothetical protein
MELLETLLAVLLLSFPGSKGNALENPASTHNL